MFNNKKKEIELYEREERLKVDERVINYRTSLIEDQSRRSVEHASNVARKDHELATLEAQIIAKKAEYSSLAPSLVNEVAMLNRIIDSKDEEIDRLNDLLKSAVGKMSASPVIVPYINK